MAAIKKRDCIRALRMNGATESEANDIVEMLLAEKARLKAAGKATPQDLSAAWSNLAGAMKHEAEMRLRRQAIATVRYGEATAFIDSCKAQGVSGMDAIQAFMVGISQRFDGARRSVSALRNGIYKSWVAPMLTELERVADGAAMRMMREDKDFHDAIFREMREPGSTGNQGAAEIAGIFARYMEQARQQLNAAGADIGKLDGWTPQNHDPYKLLKGGAEGRQEWVDFVFERLDLERTFDGIGLVDEARAKEILGRVFDNLTLGKEPHMPGTGESAGGGGPRNLTRKLEQQRVLHFRDADAALKYHDRYGRGNIFDAMLRHLEMDARALSLLERMGPDPQDMLSRLLKREQIAVHENPDLPLKEKQRQLRQLSSAFSPGIMAQGRAAAWLAELTGETNIPTRPTFARVMSTLRATQSLAKLGAASLSAVADVFVKAASMRVNGETWPGALTRSLGQYFAGYGHGRREAARQCGAFLDQIRGDIAARWDDNAGTPGLMASLQDRLFRWSGLNWMTERGKAGYTLWLSEHLGEVGERAFDQLDGPRRAMLEYHGIDAARWDAMRKMVKQGPDGKRYFFPDEAASLTDADLSPLLPESLRKNPPGKKGSRKRAQWEAARAGELERLRRNLRFDSMAMLADETGFAIIEPDDATRAIMRQGQRPGTVPGEVWRAIMQFKSFPIAYMQRVLGGRRWVRGDRQQGMRFGFNIGAAADALTRDMGGLFGFVLSSVAFGYAAMTLKDISKGRTPRSLAEKETWMAALVQSGGAGIFGDFLFGSVNRFGNSFAETAVGPLGGALGEVVKVSGELVRGDFANGAEDTLRLAMSNMPFVNLWYTRAALDWALLYHFREMLSPGTLRRTERKMKKEFGQTFILPPSEYIKRGGGFR